MTEVPLPATVSGRPRGVECKGNVKVSFVTSSLKTVTSAAACYMPFTTLSIFFAIVIFRILTTFMDFVNIREIDMSIYALITPQILYFTILGTILLIIMILISRTDFFSLSSLILLILFFYNPEIFIISGIDDHAYKASIYVKQIVDKGHFSKYDNVFFNWPFPFILAAAMSLLLQVETLATTLAIKLLYLLETAIVIYIILKLIEHELNIKINVAYILIPFLPLMYSYKFYLLTTSGFLPVFALTIYLTISRRENISKPVIMCFLMLLFTVAMVHSHGFSTLVLLSYIFGLLIKEFFEERRYEYASVIYFILFAIIIVYLLYSFNKYLLRTSINSLLVTIMNVFNIQFRKDFQAIIPIFSESIYSKTYRETLLLLNIPILINIGIGLLSSMFNTKILKKEVYLTFFIFIVAMFFRYSIETIPRIMALALPFLTSFFANGLIFIERKISSRSCPRRIFMFLLLFSTVLATLSVNIALLGQPFRYLSDVDLALYIFLDKYKEKQHLPVVVFSIKSYTNRLFYYYEAYTKRMHFQRQINECLSIIYMNAFSHRWNFPNIIGFKN